MGRTFILVLAAALPLPGCLLLAGAAVGAGVVRVAGEDAAEVVIERDYATVFAASEEEMKARGVLQSSNRETGTLRGRIGGSDLQVSVLREAETSVRARVTARRDSGVSPDPSSARLLATGIVKRTR